MTFKTTPKDFFLHLGAAIALFIAAGALINLWYAIINYLYPDALSGYYFFGGNSIAWPVSMLVVVLVPILYAIEWAIAKDIARMPEKKDIWVRRWRLYFTMFLAVILIGGDLVALISVYLNGEITARFVWKVVVILCVAGAVGKYYYFSISEKWKYARMARTGNAWFGLVLAVAGIIVGFAIVGSPAHQRALRLDSERISDLQRIQSEVVSYWQAKGGMPPSLDALNDPLSYASIPSDPETNQPYVYTVSGKDTSSFNICATFDLATPRQFRGATYPAIYRDADSNWDHDAGQACFERSIDPQKYPVSTRAVPTM